MADNYQEKGMMQAYLQGISDWFRYKNRVPVYWKDKPEGDAWQKGHKYAQEFNK